MHPAFPEIAGGFVSSTIALNTTSKDVVGCKAERTGVGEVTVTTNQAIPLGKARIWVTPMGILNPPLVSAVRSSLTEWIITTYEFGIDITPPGNPVYTAQDFDFSFGISVIPD